MTEKSCNMKPTRNSVNFPVINICCRLVCTFNRDIKVKNTEKETELIAETEKLFNAWNMDILSVLISEFALEVEFRTNLTYDIKHCVNNLKTITSRKIRTKHKEEMGSLSLWDSGYYLSSIDDSDKVSTMDYVNSQHRVKRKYKSSSKSS